MFDATLVLNSAGEVKTDVEKPDMCTTIKYITPNCYKLLFYEIVQAHFDVL